MLPEGSMATIPGWTVVTPSLYGRAATALFDLGRHYTNWDAKTGTTPSTWAGRPASQAASTKTCPRRRGETPRHWTAVNGDQAPNLAHTMNVVVARHAVATILALSAGARCNGCIGPRR